MDHILFVGVRSVSQERYAMNVSVQLVNINLMNLLWDISDDESMENPLIFKM